MRNELASATGTTMLVWRDAARVVIGVVVLPFAAVWLVDGAIAFATVGCALAARDRTHVLGAVDRARERAADADRGAPRRRAISRSAMRSAQ